MNKLKKEEYHNSTRVSNSAFNLILPECGGSPLKYEQQILMPDDDVESKAKRLGTLLHLCMEAGPTLNFDNFIETVLPTPGILKIADELIELQNGTILPIDELAPHIVRIARQNEFQNNWKDKTIVDKVTSEAGVYMLQANKAKSDGGVLVSPDEKQVILQGSKNLMKAIPWNYDNDVIHPFCAPADNVQIFREHPIEFEIDTIPCKALIDLVVVNHTQNKCWVYDLKTTATPLSIYFGYDMHSLDGKIHVDGKYVQWNVHRQLAMYQRACLTEFGLVAEPFIIGLETLPPYEVAIHKPSAELIGIGALRVMEGIDLLQKANLVGVGL